MAAERHDAENARSLVAVNPKKGIHIDLYFSRRVNGLSRPPRREVRNRFPPFFPDREGLGIAKSCHVRRLREWPKREFVRSRFLSGRFLDSGDGIVFVGEFGPWYSEDRKEFHLPPDAAEKLLRGTIKTYQDQDGRPLKEIFLHARSGVDRFEFEGFRRACPPGVDLVGVRVRKDRSGPRLFRHDDHPDPGRRGKHPVLRGTFWQRTQRHGLLFTTGFKPRLGTYDGFEVPVPLSVTIQQGDADLLQVAKDILGLTKLNYNACQLGEGQPITVKYSDRIGEILLANPEVPREYWRPNFKYYV